MGNIAKSGKNERWVDTDCTIKPTNGTNGRSNGTAVSAKKSIDETASIKDLKVADSLANADIFYGYSEFV